jgi:GNAT superfamily N-acetyltransferase
MENKRSEGSDERNQEPFGLFYAWWRGDPCPDLPVVPGLSVEGLESPESIDADVPLDGEEVRNRYEQGHQLYVACIGNEIVAWGWAASERADIGELGISMTMPPANRYLWDFVTLPEWRGQGIYGWIIQAMLHDQADADRFWIGHDYDNRASGKGILRAGFYLVGELYQGPDGFYLAPVDLPDRTPIAAEILGVLVAADGATET